jgi:hypothetical protein
MKFRTEVKIPRSENKIDYSKTLFFIGSCFSNNIGQKFYDIFFNTLINPFGVLYNPLSVANSLQNLIDKKIYKEKDLVFHNGQWHSFEHHSSFSGFDKTDVLRAMNESRKNAGIFLQQTDFLFITFGTSYIYQLKENKKIVANCHKFPQNIFDRRVLEIDEIVDIYNVLIKNLKKINPKIQIIFTVSPIRHLKDGAKQNNLSKSILFVAINKLIEKNNGLAYFPSYEIVMDELRDYRYYAADMIHISDIAVEYIWEKISDVFFDNLTKEQIKKTSKLSKLLNHRIMHKDNIETEKYISACKKLSDEVKKIEKKINVKLIDENLQKLTVE